MSRQRTECAALTAAIFSCFTALVGTGHFEPAHWITGFVAPAVRPYLSEDLCLVSRRHAATLRSPVLQQHRCTRQGVAGASTAVGKYRALTRIRLRESPDISSAPTGGRLEPGEVFEVEDIVAPATPGELHYLRVAGRNGWIFDQGIVGEWVGKPIVELLEEPASVAPAEPVASPSPAEAEVVGEAVEPSVSLAMAQVDTLRLPDNMLGAGYEFVRIEVQGERVLTFMLGCAFPRNVLTPRGQELLGDLLPKPSFSGGWMSAAAQASTIDLKDLKFAATGAPIDDLNNCDVLDFPQAQLAEQLGVEVHGILGQPFFAGYDMDLDRYGGRVQFFAPGQAASQGFYSTVKHLPGLDLPAGNLGIALKGKSLDVDDDKFDADTDRTFIGLVDTSAAHTVVNWKAAEKLGFSGPDDPILKAATKVLGAGAQGQAEELPVVRVRFTLCGVPQGVKPMMVSVSKEQFESGGGVGWYLDGLGGGSGCVEFGAVNVAIGDVLSLGVLSDSKIGQFQGAAAIIGQDLLFQAQRIVLNSRDRQLWLEPGDVQDALDM